MPDLILRSSTTSPFGRKVKLALHVLGLFDRVTVELGDTMNPDDSLRQQNPLGKIPILILADGTRLYDSRVIVEYLDHLAGGGRIIPTDSASRFEVLTLQATADGLMDAGILRRYETVFHPPEAVSLKWDDHQRGKVDRTLALLEAMTLSETRISVGEISVACALGYLDFRYAGAWRDSCPALEAWLAGFAARCPGFEATLPH